MRRRLLPVLIFAFFLLCAPFARAADEGRQFFLRDSDTVLFYGDSITEQLSYGRDIENYVVTRFPKWHVKFINSGVGGDRVTGGYEGAVDLRLKRDVLPYKPTVITILLGMNDGSYQAYNEGIFQTYAKGMTHLVDTLHTQLPKARLVLLTPTFFDKDAKGSSDNPYNSTLIRYGDFVKKFGAERGLPVVDLNAPMAAATAKGRAADPNFALFGDPTKPRSGDGVHPNEAGHLVMASAILTAWHAPGTVADIALTPGKPVTVIASLPWPVPGDAAQAFATSPFPAALNVFRIHADALPAATYTLLVDSKPVGTLTKEQLAMGVDLTQNADLPMTKQAQEVAGIVRDRVDRWHGIYKSPGFANAADTPSREEIAALIASDKYLDSYRSRAHDAAQPKPHTLEIRAVGS